MNNLLNDCTILPLFSKVFYLKILKNIKIDKIMKIIKEEEYIKSGSINNNLNVDNISNSSNNKYILENKKLNFLKKILLEEFNIFKNNILKYKNNFKITTSWIALSKKEQKSNLHNHQNSFYSGILYLQTDDKTGDICFEGVHNNVLRLECESYNLYNSTSWNFKPINCMLIFFPSEIHHQILKNNSNIERYSLAFNLMPVGKIGLDGSDGFFNLKILK